MSRPSIPDNIYNNRCRYCMHFTGLPNTTGELSTGQLFSCKPSTPCNIISIAKYCEQKIINYHPVSCTYEVHDNECFSFTPNYGYPGICDSCRYSNHFFDKSDYCRLPKEEITDRHPLLIGCTYSQRKTDYWTYAYHTCSKWQLSDSWYNTAKAQLRASFPGRGIQIPESLYAPMRPTPRYSPYGISSKRKPPKKAKRRSKSPMANRSLF